MNLYVSQYGKDFEVGYDCSGEASCRFALCETMPPVNAEDVCTFKVEGSCRNISAQMAALEKIKARISAEIKNLKEDD